MGICDEKRILKIFCNNGTERRSHHFLAQKGYFSLLQYFAKWLIPKTTHFPKQRNNMIILPKKNPTLKLIYFSSTLQAILVTGQNCSAF
jgi:hypothetical protein